MEDDSLTTGQLRDIAGLSSRQVSEWDHRDALPSQRDGQRGWRRITLSQALAVTIGSKINKKFGTPVGEVRRLIAWMQGEELTRDAVIVCQRAEDHLTRVSPREARRRDVQRDRAQKRAVRRLRSNSAGSVDTRSAPVGNDDPLYLPLVDSAVQQLLKRGWEEHAARAFCELFYDMSGRSRGTQHVMTEYLQLHQLANAADDRIAREAAQMLAGALVPLVTVIGAMSAGVPMYLITDLSRNRFVNEFVFVELVRQGLLRDSEITLYLNDLINDMFEKIGKPRMPVRHSASEDDARVLSEKEAEIIRLLRRGDFSSVYIKPAHEGYTIYIEIAERPEDVAEATALISKHEYETIALTRAGGKTIQVTRTVPFHVK